MANLLALLCPNTHNWDEPTTRQFCVIDIFATIDLVVVGVFLFFFICVLGDHRAHQLELVLDACFLSQRVFEGQQIVF